MARKNKYSKVKPKVSPLTYAIMAIVFIGLLLAVIFSINTPKENFNNRFGLDKDNIYELIKFKDLERKIDNDEELIVIIAFEKKSMTPASLLRELINVYDEDNKTYNESHRDNLTDVVYYLELVDEDLITDFVDKYEVSLKTQDPMMIAFNNGEIVAEFNGAKTHETNAANQELANLIRNIKEFLLKLNVEDN